MSNTRLITVLGSGGVGKTTTSASLALSLAAQGHKCVVITVDPAKRLAQALGLKNLSIEAQRVFENSSNGGHCDALWLDPTTAFDELVRRLGGNSPNVAKVLSHRLFKIIRDQLGGIEEYLGVDRVLKLIQTQKYDYCILDTPPSRHALDFLESPKHLLRFFDDGVIKYFVSDKEETSKQGFFSKILNSGKGQAIDIFKNFLGKGFISELAELLTYLKPVRESLKNSAQEIENVLRSPRARIVLVSLLEAYPLDEVRLLKSELLGADLPSPHLLILNKCLPQIFPEIPTSNDTVVESLRVKSQIQTELRKRIRELQICPLSVELPRFSPQNVELKQLEELGNAIVGPWAAFDKTYFSKIS